ncbi:MAG: MBL fold metallo-hydrolase [Cytophagales bacterium]|uniref:MBL fold metallo-hydrolase n=1 Tax=Cyclobacterium marinum TaxID=104 RepID=UPI0011EE26D4|nr:MBL fold metallo-hydrolase [Cyclobacterium marinum]MBI0398961.1 MBL fold metallo-hydrolase [Cyclobacterium marinum]MBR9775997.1 MBL fold metallo-hydrolase [Cytophagales bacterium]|tara:strand:+ start:10964 stop:11617 length:654 start_codon:yes stop_codon:yes gene_type:complete
MLQIKSFTFNPFSENTYILYDETKEALIIDPGCYEKQEKGILYDFITEEQLKPVKIINTHCHIDHVLGNAFIKKTYNIPLWFHEKEEPILLAVGTYAPNYGFAQYQESTVDHFLQEGEIVKFGKTELKPIWVPGHSPGHLVLYHEASKNCIAGDTLFQGSIGRTDLPGGDHETLIHSIKEKLFSLPDEVVIHPGHGPTTTIGFEKLNNPFVGKNARN